jgi:beta-1,4-mannooligosaccharide/beta-1,4-mannosyl-N-acetylglucosamine phosphorylase
VGNVVFTCGALLDGDEVKVYYGAADHVMCLATASVDDILYLCLQSNG